MINLCVAIASFGRAMQRQADNRNHLIAQVVFVPIASREMLTLLCRAWRSYRGIGRFAEQMLKEWTKSSSTSGVRFSS